MNGYHMKIYQTCWIIFNNVLFNDNTNCNYSDNYENVINRITDMEYIADFYLICLSALHKTPVNLFDVNFDSKYTNVPKDENDCKFKRRVATFNSIYACDQLLARYQHVCNQTKTAKKINQTKIAKLVNQRKIFQVEMKRYEITDWVMEKRCKNNMKINGGLGLEFECMLLQNYVYRERMAKNMNIDCKPKKNPRKALWILKYIFSYHANTGDIHRLQFEQRSLFEQRLQFQELEKQLNDLSIIERGLCLAIMIYFKSLSSYHDIDDNCSNNINDNDKNVDIVYCNQLFQDLFNNVSTYLRYCQMVGVSQHIMTSVNCDDISTIFLCYALYLWNIKSNKSKKYFKYCLKLTPLNGIIYYYFSLYLFQIEKNYKQSFYNLKVSKKLGCDLDIIAKQFQLLYKKFEWKTNSIGFICDYNQCKCNNSKIKGKKLICSNCKCAWYCSKMCQKKDWIVKHKDECIGKHLLLLNSKEEDVIRQQIWLIKHS